jgi:sugar lactone lactonase YvrE
MAAGWQSEIQHIQTSQRWNFGTLDELLGILRQMAKEVRDMLKRLRSLGITLALLVLLATLGGTSIARDHTYSGDDDYDPAAGGSPEESVVAIPDQATPATVPTFSGDDAYDPAAGGLPELSVTAGDGVQVVSDFSSADGGLPEGLIIDKSGNMYVTVGYPFWFEIPEGFGEVWRIDTDGQITVLDAWPGGPSGAGLAVGPSGVLYYAYPNPPDPDTNGVYRLDGQGERERLPGSENIALANGLALNRKGDLYVSDSLLGAVWRIPHDGGAAEIWARHEFLAGCDVGGFGANGVALWKESLYVANTDMGLLTRVPILEDGRAGEPEIIAGDSDCDPSDELFSMDGLALDVHGNVFALLVLTSKLVRIDPVDGSHTVLLTAEDGLSNPASIAFGTGKGNRQSVLMSNFALLEPGPPGNLGPGVLKLDVGTPGLPLP